MLHYGSIEGGVCVLHKCDNPKCVNPSHLFLGSGADNMRDKINKGRQTKGEANGAPKLNEESVKAIRKMASKNKANRGEIAARFGVSRRCISAVVSGAAWRHIR